MCDELTVFQKLMLRWALRNYEAAHGVPRKKRTVKREIANMAGGKEVSRKKCETRVVVAAEDDRLDLDQKELLHKCFGVTYTPTQLQDSGLSTDADKSPSSRQYYVARDIISNAMLELASELAEPVFYGPSGLSERPERIAFNLTGAGIEFARQLEGEFTHEQEECWQLDPETEARYHAALAERGISLEDIEQAQQDFDSSASETATSLEPIVQLLRSNDPSWRMAAVQYLLRLGKRAKEAIPSLRLMLEDSETDIRTWAVMALKAIEGDEEPETAQENR